MLMKSGDVPTKKLTRAVLSWDARTKEEESNQGLIPDKNHSRLLLEPGQIKVVDSCSNQSPIAHVGGSVADCLNQSPVVHRGRALIPSGSADCIWKSMAGKLIINKNLIRTLPSSSLRFSLRRLHESAYEKDVEDEVEAAVSAVKDMSTDKPDEYWEPDPDTGVFVPAAEQNSEEPAVTCTTEETVLDEKVFFRPLEDLELPSPEKFTGEIPPVDPFAE